MGEGPMARTMTIKYMRAKASAAAAAAPASSGLGFRALGAP